MEFIDTIVRINDEIIILMLVKITHNDPGVYEMALEAAASPS